MKKKILIICVLLFSVVVCFSGACTIRNDNKRSDARNIAVEQFGFEKIFVATGGTRNSVLLKTDTPRYVIYVLGEKDGEEKMIVVPALKKEQSYEVDWPFNESFKSIAAKVNETLGEEYWNESNFESVEFLDNCFEVFGLDESKMDTKFAVGFGKYFAYQNGGEIIVHYCA